jgi:bacteriorhodopsin
VSRRTTRAIRREKPAGRPSIFFIVALAIGIALVLWFFIQMIRHPPKPQRTAALQGLIEFSSPSDETCEQLF